MKAKLLILLALVLPFIASAMPDQVSIKGLTPHVASGRYHKISENEAQAVYVNPDRFKLIITPSGYLYLFTPHGRLFEIIQVVGNYQPVFNEPVMRILL